MILFQDALFSYLIFGRTRTIFEGTSDMRFGFSSLKNVYPLIIDIILKFFIFWCIFGTKCSLSLPDIEGIKPEMRSRFCTAKILHFTKMKIAGHFDDKNNQFRRLISFLTPVNSIFSLPLPGSR